MKIIGTRTIYGQYGRQMQVDEDGNDLEVKVEQVKRGRGRPKKLINECQMEWSKQLESVMRKWSEV